MTQSHEHVRPEAAAPRERRDVRGPAGQNGVAPVGAPSRRDRAAIVALQQTAGNAAAAQLLRQPAATEEEDPKTKEGVAELQSGGTTTGEKISITRELLMMLTPGMTRSQPDLKRSHRKKYTYKPVAGQLPSSAADVRPTDVEQGALGDCYLLSAMAAIARANPQAIANLIKDNKDGTYDVTLYEKQHWYSSKRVPKVVKVTATFPSSDAGTAYATPARMGATGLEIWPLLIEKAYAKEHGGYSDIEGGFGSTAMTELTGKASEEHSLSGSDDELVKKIDKFIKDGNAVTAASDHPLFPWNKKKATKAGVVTGHEYSVKSVDVANKTISLQNPWGMKDLDDMSIANFKKYFRTYSTNPTK